MAPLVAALAGFLLPIGLLTSLPISLPTGLLLLVCPRSTSITFVARVGAMRGP
ncbi:hypothetical protein VDGL01_12613 [Verticillium dahliae]